MPTNKAFSQHSVATLVFSRVQTIFTAIRRFLPEKTFRANICNYIILIFLGDGRYFDLFGK
jgi:hypothetical protein